MGQSELSSSNTVYIAGRLISWLAVLATVAFGLSMASALPAMASEGCVENESVRAEQKSTYLPRCRAYELVSPPGAVPKFGGSPKGLLESESVRASQSGERIAFATYYPAQGAKQASMFYLSRRGADGWSTEALTPPLSASVRTGCSSGAFFSAELTTMLLSDGEHQAEYPYCGHNEPSLVDDEPSGWRNEAELEFGNVLLREDLDAPPAYRLINRTPTSTTPSGAHLQDVSEDFSHVLFSEAAQLTPEAPSSGEALYEWVDDVVHLVSVLPDGKGVAGEIVDGEGANLLGAAPFMHGASTDGSRVFFTAEGDLFVRENADQPQSEIKAGVCTEPTKACTKQIDKPEAGGSGGGGNFLAATADGSRVFFTDEATAMLTTNTVTGSKANLYEYEVSTGTLRDLTAVAGARVVGVSGFGQTEDESSWYLYFVAEGTLAAGAVAGHPNLYVIHKGEAPKFIATLSETHDESDWNTQVLTPRTSASGRLLAFDSARTQTTTNFPAGYDNAGKEEIYLYDAESQALTCVSCQPSGAAPEKNGTELLQPIHAALIFESAPGYLQRTVLEDGTVYFQSEEALLHQEEEAEVAVYEYSGGELHRLSSGAPGAVSLFMEASETGADVFIATTQELVKADTDGALSVYDVRVDGGFPESPQQPPGCAGEECRGAAPLAPVFETPASVEFAGSGNIQPRESGKPLSRRQKLARALKACRRKPKKRRRVCEAAAHQKFGAKMATHPRTRGR
jgi:hypothetical protein